MRLEDIDGLWLIGCGAMGGALLDRWRRAGLRDAAVTVIDPDPKGLPDGYAGRRADGVAEAGAPPAVVVLGFKPQQLAAAAPALAAATADASPLIMSMLAGVRIATLAQLFPAATLARIMPNTPVRIGQGVTGVVAPGLAAAHRDAIDALLAPTGSSVWLDDEARLDALTAVSGSGPAYLFRFIEVLAGAAESAGFDAATAAELALRTVAGAAALAADSAQSPAQLRINVTSPNGVTQAAVDVLDGDGALSALMRATVRAAAERSRAMALEAAAPARVVA